MEPKHETESTDIAEALTRWMETFAGRSWQDSARFIKAAGLSMPQFGTLIHLSHRGSCAVSDVSGHMDISNAAASQLVDRLVQQGLVERREDPHDRRVRALSLTDKGRELVENGMRERFRWIEEMVSGLTAEDRKVIAAALPALVQAARRCEAREPDAEQRKPFAGGR